MADDLGIKRCWFHKSHYDLPKTRIEEITKKCEVVSSKDIVRIIKDWKTFASSPIFGVKEDMSDSTIGTKVKELKAQGLRPTTIAKVLGIDITAVYYHISPDYREKSLQRSTERRKQNKIFAIGYKGGKCLKCGYNKCSDALVFHHKDPQEKDFAIAGTTLSQETLKRELDKTVMLCAICHIELHAGQWSEAELKQHGLTYIPAGLNTGRKILPPSKLKHRQ